MKKRGWPCILMCWGMLMFSLTMAESVGDRVEILTGEGPIARITSRSQLMTLNLLASIGPDGILLVDPGLAPEAPELKAKLEKMGRVRYIINTHGDGDHVQGNRVFTPEAVVIAHTNTRERLSGRYFALEPLAGPGIPVITFTDEISLFFNGEEIRLKHFPAMHTDEDVAVFFTRSRIVYLGDVVFPDAFPASHYEHGGDLSGYPRKLQAIIDHYPDDVTFVSTHGRDYSKVELKQYRDRVASAMTKIRERIRAGASVRSLIDDGTLFAWKQWLEDGFSREEPLISLVNQAFGSGAPPPVSVNQPLTQILVNQGIEQMVAAYHRLRKEEPDQYDFGERELNNLGYQLLARQRTSEAVAVLRLNVDTYPESANVYDSLGEALMLNGRQEEAIRNYRKSLELNPANDNAREQLKKLGATPTPPGT